MSQMASEQGNAASDIPATSMHNVKADDETSQGHSAAEVKADVDTYQEQSTGRTVLLVSSVLLCMFLVALDRTIISTVRNELFDA
jgi:hypothetical protein